MDFNQIIKEVRIGATLLYPTDTTFGLGCDALNPTAIQKIYQIKNRPDSKSLIILVENAARLQSIVDVPALAWDIMDLSEKPVTIIYDNPRNLPNELIADDNTIAIRLTKDPLCKKIIGKINAPLVSTSANLSDEPSPQRFEDISQKIIDEVDFVLDECKDFTPKYNASSIIKLSGDGKVRVIRE